MSATTSLPHAPAPWSLTGSGYVFVVEPQPFSPSTPVALPAGSYHPSEAGTAFDRSSNFHGGVGAILVVRYASSDVGPYDELMIIPGNFSNEHSDGSKTFDLCITRIYVSSKASVRNGRENWGIPKHQAAFSFTPVTDRPGSKLMTVSNPGSSESFFSAIMTTSRFTPFSIPVTTSLAASSIARSLLRGFKPVLVQPPLPSCADSQDAKSNGEDPTTLVGSPARYSVAPTSSGWGKLCTLSPVQGRPKFGDGNGFPEFEPWWGGKGFELTSFRMDFPVPDVVD